jgi:hypothetical protein
MEKKIDNFKPTKTTSQKYTSYIKFCICRIFHILILHQTGWYVWINFTLIFSRGCLQVDFHLVSGLYNWVNLCFQQIFTQLYKSETTSTKYYKIVQVWKHFNKDLSNCTSLKPLQQSITKLYKSETTSTKIYPIVQVWKHLTKFYPIVQLDKSLLKCFQTCTIL